MLTKRDLRPTYKTFNFFSSLNLFPISFKPILLGGQMESGKSSIWKRIGFKMWQVLLTAQTLFILSCTLSYVTGVGFGLSGRTVDVDWDFFPMILILLKSSLAVNLSNFLMFDPGRELTRNIYNEIIKLRGKCF